MKNNHKIRKYGRKERYKNWMPFEYINELYFVYIISPHIILKCDINTGICNKLYETDNINNKIKYDHIPNLLKMSHIECNVPPIIINMNKQKYYLNIGHVSQILSDNTIPIRKSFFYIFNYEPPFDIIMYGKPFDIMNEYYALVELVCGLIIKNNIVTISAGINDTYSILCDINLDEILNSLYKV